MAFSASGSLSALAVRQNGRTARLSSSDPTGGNLDYWMIEPGTAVTIGDIDGPGCINHLWMTSFCRKILGPGVVDPYLGSNVAPVNEIHNALGVVWEEQDPSYYRKLLIRITWDNADGPSVLVPMGDFFGVGHSFPGNYESAPLNVSLKPEEAGKFGAPCSRNSYFQMPFQENARVELVNEGDLPVGVYFYLDYELYSEPLPADTLYFHSSWKRSNPCNGWAPELQVNSPEIQQAKNVTGDDNYVVLETKGAGNYVGCNLSVTHFAGSWWGEGDDMIFIDGEEEASIAGTGTEDYFLHAWGMQKNAFQYNGSTLHESELPGYQVSYRFHVLDPVRFDESIKVTIEHGHANHLSDDWASTAYWYQYPPRSDLEIQPVDERLPYIPSIESPRKEYEGTLTVDQRKAKERAAERDRNYRAGKNEELQKKYDATRKAELLGIERAKKLRERIR